MFIILKLFAFCMLTNYLLPIVAAGRMPFSFSNAKFEVERLRDEIKNAVAQDYYAVPPEGRSGGGGNANMFSPMPIQMNFIPKLPFLQGTKFGSKSSAADKKHMVGASLEQSNETISTKYEENLKSDAIDTNIIYGKNSVQKSKCKHTLNEYRDALSIQAIKENVEINVGANVREWKTLIIQNNKPALIGITQKTVVLLVDIDNNFQLIKEIELPAAISGFDTFNHWNESRDMDAFVVIGVEQYLYFIRVDHRLNDMEIFWTMPTQAAITALHEFSIDHSNMMAVMNNVAGSEQGTLVNIYTFHVDSKEFLLHQQIRLAVRTDAMSFLESGTDYFLCFPQNDTVKIYTHVMKWFDFFIDIPAMNAQAITTFRMGGHSYLAIGGDMPRILRYIRGSFHSQTILEKSWGTVDLFIAIEARTYRDDLILFVQHQIDFESHAINVLDALIWNGEAFEADLTTPCFIFGKENDHGISCLLDSEYEDGIVGATIIHTDKVLQILVPRHEVPPALFDIEFQLVPTLKNEREEDIFNLFRDVADLFDGEDDVYADIAAIFNHIASNEITASGQSFEEINTLDLEVMDGLQAEFMTENGDTFTIQQLADLAAILNETNQLLDENQKQKRQTEATVQVVKSLQATNINVEYINGVPISEFEIGSDGTLRLNGTLVVSASLDADNVKRHNEDVAAARHSTGAFSTAFMDIAENLHVDIINGIPWNEFINDIVLKNGDSNDWLDLVIHGELIAHADLQIEKLNDVNYPNDFVWNNGSSENVITGLKKFENVLLANEIDCIGLINGVNPSLFVTRSSPQTIPGLTRIKRLEITDLLEIYGHVQGRHLNEFLANPDLRQTQHVTSTCLFNEIIVDGPIIINKQYNNIQLVDIFSNVLYNNEPNAIIPSLKKFRTLKAELTATSGLLNGIPLDQYMTKDTQQEFKLPLLCGNIVFHRLHLHGLFDFLNVTELYVNAVRLTGEQYTKITLAFEGIGGLPLKIYANDLQVLETVNEHDVHGFLTTNENFELHGHLHVNDLKVDLLNLNGELVDKSKTLTGWNLQRIAEFAILNGINQNLSAAYHINTVIVKKNKGIKKINGFDVHSILDRLAKERSNVEYMKDSRVHVEQFIVDGSVFVHYINGFHINKIESAAIYLDRPVTLFGTLRFMDQIVVNGNLNTNLLLDEPFDKFINNVVKRQDEFIMIKGNTTILQDIYVTDSLEPEFTHGVSTNFILSKTADQIISKPFRFIGKVAMPILSCDGFLNDIDCHTITKIYSFDYTKNVHRMHADVHFTQPTVIINLQLNAGFNDIGNVTEFLYDIVRKDAPVALRSTKVFHGFVHFDMNVKLLEHKGVDLIQFFSKILFVNDGNLIQFDTDVFFIDLAIVSTIDVKKNVILHADVQTPIDFDDWLENSINLNVAQNFSSKFVFGNGALATSKLGFLLKHLNRKSLKKIITLFTPQKFKGTIHLGDVLSSVPFSVAGLVNSLNLTAAKDDTMQLNGNQVIHSPLMLTQPLRVLFNLTTSGPINGKLLSAIRLDKDVLLHSPITFQNITVDSFAANGLTSGINFNDWASQALKKISQNTQVVSGNWAIRNGVLSSLFGNGMVNNVPATSLLERLTTDTQRLRSVATFLNDTYKMSCAELKTHVDLSHVGADGAMALQFFDFAYKTSHDWRINSIHTFVVDANHFLIINSRCQSYLYAWNNSLGKFAEMTSFNSGIVNSWMHILNGPKMLHLISNGVDRTLTCAESGLNIWTLKLADIVIVHSQKIADDLLSIQKKLNSTTTFYGMSRNGSHVLEYDLSGNVVERWAISKDPTRIPRFIPAEANMGLAISDGKTLSVLSSSRSERHIRSTNLDDVDLTAIVDCSNGSKSKRCLDFTNNQIVGTENPFKLKPFTKCNLHQKFNELLRTAAPKMREKLLLPKINFVAIKKNQRNGSSFRQDEASDAKEKEEINNANQGAADPMVGATAGDIGHIVVDIIRVVGDILGDDFDYDVGNAQNQNASDSHEPILSDGIEDKIDLIAHRIVDRILDEIWQSVEDGHDKTKKPAKSTAAIDQKPMQGHESDISMADIRISEKIVIRTSQLLSERINASVFINKTCENATEPDKNIVGDAYGQISEVAIGIADRIADQMIAAIQENRENEEEADEDNDDVGDAFGNIQEEATNMADSLTDRLIEHLHNRDEFDDISLLDVILSSVHNKSNLNASEIKHSIENHRNNTERGRIEIISSIAAAAKIVSIGKMAWGAAKWIGNKIGGNGKGRADIEHPAIAAVDQSRAAVAQKHIVSNQNRPIVDQSRTSADETGSVGDAVIGNVISSHTLTTENAYLPANGNGEILALKVGPLNKVLYAISDLKENVVKGDHDSILIYEDIMEGKIYQTIPCFKPHQLFSFQIGRDTFLLFVEAESIVKIYIYRGLSGFKEFSKFDMGTQIANIDYIEITTKAQLYSCKLNYLILSVAHEVWFLKADVKHNCVLDPNINCKT